MAASTATDFEWRKALWCAKEPDCSTDDLDGGRIDDWDRSQDLDGDGVKETIRAFMLAHQGTAEVHVYLGAAPCATHVTTMSSTFTVLPTRHDGWADLQVIDGDSFCQGMMHCGCRASETFYVHANGTYVEDPSRAVAGILGSCASVGDPCTDSIRCLSGKCASGHCTAN